MIRIFNFSSIRWRWAVELCLSMSGRFSRGLFELLICGEKHLFDVQWEICWVNKVFIFCSTQWRRHTLLCTKSREATAHTSTFWCCGTGLVDRLTDDVGLCIVASDGYLTPVILLVLNHGTAEICTVIFNDLSEMANVFRSEARIFCNIGWSCIFVLIKPWLHRSLNLLFDIWTVGPWRILVDVLTSIWKCWSLKAFVMLEFTFHDVQSGQIGELRVPSLEKGCYLNWICNGENVEKLTTSAIFDAWRYPYPPFAIELRYSLWASRMVCFCADEKSITFASDGHLTASWAFGFKHATWLLQILQ